MKRKQKHYKTEQEIIERIDELKQEAEGLNKSAEFLSEKHLSMMKEHITRFPDDDWGALPEDDRNRYAQALQMKIDAAASRKKAKRIEEIRLPQLGEKLSEFRGKIII